MGREAVEDRVYSPVMSPRVFQLSTMFSQIMFNRSKNPATTLTVGVWYWRVCTALARQSICCRGDLLSPPHYLGPAGSRSFTFTNRAAAAADSIARQPTSILQTGATLLRHCHVTLQIGANQTVIFHFEHHKVLYLMVEAK